ncbi:MAG TPA: ABC transporter ATP-binding protein [Rectinemataceae bacterium]|nr:ABC transporter ATP-binding protein [Rectinemataceae bacterium]
MGFLMDGLETEAYDRSYSDRDLVARILAYFRPSRRRLILVGLALASAALAEFASQVVISKSLDAAGRSGTRVSNIVLLALAIAGFGLIEWLLNYARQYLTGRSVGETILRLRSDAFARALSHDLSFYDEESSGKVVSRVTTDTEDFANVIGLVVDFISQVILVVVFFSYLATISPRLSLLLLAMAPAAVILALSYRFHLRRGITLVVILPIVGIASGGGNGLLAWFGGSSVRDGLISLGEWFLFMQAVGYFWWPLLNIASFWSQLQDGLAAAERGFSLIDREPRVRQSLRERGAVLTAADAGEITGGPIATGGGSDSVSGAGGRGSGPGGGPEGGPEGGVSIRFESVGFAYSSKERVLEGFDLDIAAGERLAIVGHTGAGKSSLIKLIARFYEFQEGRIEFGGRDIRSIPLDAIRGAIGLVSQDPFLFPGSVLDNIRYAKPGADEREVEAAARSLGRGDWVDDLPQGLATPKGTADPRSPSVSVSW